MNNKGKKIKPKIALLYIIVILILIYVTYTIVLLIKNPTDTVIVEYGSIYEEESYTGYVIRDEVVVQGENYENGMEQIKSEGEKVAKYEAIFRYYNEKEDILTKKIVELDLEIQVALESETTIYSTDIELINDNIEEKLKELYDVKSIVELNNIKDEIEELITKKSNIAGENSPQGSYLSELIEERKQYEIELNTDAEYITAPISGLVSYKVDGLEEILVPTEECYNTLNSDYLDSLNLTTGSIVASSDENGKIIDNTACYIAFVIDMEKLDEKEDVEVGDDLDIILQGTLEIDAEIIYKSLGEDNKYTLVLEIDRYVNELCNYRKITFDIVWWSDSGFKVPNSAIVLDEETGLNYVVRNRSGYLNKLLINIEGGNDNYSIVSSYTTEELEELGYSTDEVNNSRKIALYDELVLYPTLEGID